MRRKNVGRVRAAVWASAAAVGIWGHPASAQLFTWTNAAGGVFGTGGNWNPAGPPTLGTQTAVFNLPSTYAVTFAAGASHGTLNLSAGTVSYAAASSMTYSVSTVSINTATLSLGANIRLAPSGVTTLNPGSRVNVNLGGTLSAAQNVVLSGGHLNVAVGGDFALGANRTLNVQSGGTVSFAGGHTLNASRTYIFADGTLTTGLFLDVGRISNGTLLFSGPSARCSVAADSVVGIQGGTGEVTFINGAAGTFGGIGLGSDNNPASFGRAVVGDATLTAGNLNIGAFGEGRGELRLDHPASRFNVTGTLSTTIGTTTAGASNGQLIINGGTFTGGTGAFTLNQRGLVAVNSGGRFRPMGDVVVNGGMLNVNSGTFTLAAGKTLAIQSGGTVTLNLPVQSSISLGQTLNITDGIYSTNARTNAGSASSGTMLVNGPNARLVNDGGPTIGVGGGEGTVIVSNAGLATYPGGVSVGADSIFPSTGLLQIDSGGRVNVSGGLTQVGRIQSFGTVSINDGTFTAAAGLTLFLLGRVDIAPGGTLIVSGGPTTIAGGTLTRQSSAASALQLPVNQPINISHNGLLSVNGGFNLPSGCNLTASSGGDLEMTGTDGLLNIGTAPGQTGTLTVTGAGSQARASTSTGTSNWGTGMGSATVNFLAGGVGTFGAINLGVNGQGVLNVTGGAQLTAGTLVAGGGAGAATILVSGANSAINVNQFQSDGTVIMSITALGALNAAQTTLSSGTLTINGGSADLGALTFTGGAVNHVAGALAFSGTLSSASGILGANPMIAPNQIVSVSGSTSLDPFSTVTLAGGQLNTSTITSNGGTLDWNSGTLGITGFQGFVVSPTDPLGSDLTVGSSRALAVPFHFQVATGSTFTQAGGRVSVGSMTVNGLYDYAGGAVSVANAATISTSGALVVEANRTFAFAAPLSNSGLIEMGGGAARIESSLALTNTTTGLITGDGTVARVVINTGEIRAESGKTLRFPIGITGAGRINLLGGGIDVATLLTNTGSITGRGAISTLGLTNNATIQLSSGFSDVTGALTNSSGARTIVSGGAVASFYSPVVNEPGSELRVSSGSSAVFFGNVTGTGQITGAGTAVFEAGTAPGPLINAGRSIVGPAGVLDATEIRQTGLSIEGRANLQQGIAATVSRVSELLIFGAPGAWDGTLDLGNNAFIFDYAGPSPRATVGNQIFSGYASGAWTGSGISSSAAASQANRAVGFADAVDLGSPGAFLGESIDATTLLLRYTLPGDANLDAIVNIGDFSLLAINFNKPAYWARGDFNYDGVAGIGDFSVLAANFNQALPADIPRSSVPEPTVLSVAFAAVLLLRRRR